MKDFYTENYKTLMEEIKETQINRKISCVHGLEGLSKMVKCLYQCYLQSQRNCYKNSNGILTDLL